MGMYSLGRATPTWHSSFFLEGIPQILTPGTPILSLDLWADSTWSTGKGLGSSYITAHV